MQNAAARVLARVGGREHIIPVFVKLHWLPVQYRIIYRTLHGLAPAYLTALLAPIPTISGTKIRSAAVSTRSTD